MRTLVVATLSTPGGKELIKKRKGIAARGGGRGKGGGAVVKTPSQKIVLQLQVLYDNHPAMSKSNRTCL